jgi:hypothetical protein
MKCAGNLFRCTCQVCVRMHACISCSHMYTTIAYADPLNLKQPQCEEHRTNKNAKLLGCTYPLTCPRAGLYEGCPLLQSDLALLCNVCVKHHEIARVALISSPAISAFTLGGVTRTSRFEILSHKVVISIVEQVPLSAPDGCCASTWRVKT